MGLTNLQKLVLQFGLSLASADDIGYVMDDYAKLLEKLSIPIGDDWDDDDSLMQSIHALGVYQTIWGITITREEGDP